MVLVIGEQNSIAHSYLLELRDKDIQQNRARFRNNLRRLGQIMAYEISKKFDYIPVDVKTSLGISKSHKLSTQPVLITIMRAGLPYFAGFQDLLEEAENGFIGAYRQENGNTLSIQLDYLATPSLEGRQVIIVDPMLATGRSLTDAVEQLMKRGKPAHVHIASVVASPEGIQHVHNILTTPHTIWTYAIDEKLNSMYYIVPGLGDAGDLSLGPNPKLHVQEIAKAIPVILFSALKFVLGPTLGLAERLHFLTTAIATIIGMMLSVVVFVYFGNWIRTRVFDRFFPRRKKISIPNPRMESIWKKYGLAGIAALTPVILTPIGGTLLAISFGGSQRKIIAYMLVSAVFWSVILTTVVYVFGHKMLPNWIK